MYQECMTREMRADFENLFMLHLKEVRFAAQHTQDGPLVKWIMQWKQQQYQQSERPQVPGEDEIVPIDWDGNEGVGGERSVDETSDEMSHGWKQEGHHRSGLLPVPPGTWPAPAGCLDSRKQ